MASLGELFVVVGANIKGFEAAMGTVSQRLNAAERDADKAFSGFERVGNSLKGVGTTMSVAVTLPIVGVGVAAIKMAGDFELSMNKIKALGDITGENLERLRAQALKLGADTQFSAQQAADAMVVFASAGFDANQVYEAMPGTLALAAAGQLSVADAATISKDVMGQFGLTAKETGHIADVLAQAAADSSASLQEMGVTLTYVGPVSKGAGQSLEETTAAIVGLDQAGIRAEKAGTGLRGVIGSLLAPSNKAATEIGELGVKISDTSGKILPLSDIMEQFKQKLSGVGSEAEKQRIIFEIFGREAGNTAQVLIGKGGPALDELEQKLISSTGAADRMAKTINSGVNFSLDQLKGSVETAGIALGTALLPVAGRIIDTFTQLVNTALIPAIDWFTKLDPMVQNLGIGFIALVAAAGPVIFIMGQMLTSFATVGSAFTAMSVHMAPLLSNLSVLPGMVSNVATAVTSNMVGALTAGEMVILRMGQAAVVAAAAFAAWKLGQWAYDNIPGVQKLGDAMGWLLLKLPGVDALMEEVTNSTSGLNAANQSAADSVKSLEHALKLKGIQIDKTGLSSEQYKYKLLAAAKAAGASKAEIEKNTEAIKKQPGPIKNAVTGHDDLGKAVKKTGDELKEGKRRVIEFHDELLEATVAKYISEHRKLVGELVDLKVNLERAKAAGKDWDAQLDANIAAAGGLSGKLVDLSSGKIPAYTTAVIQSGNATDTFGDALKRLGVRSTTDFETVAKEAAKARDVVLGSGIATDFEKNSAVYKALQAQIEAARAAGIEVPKEQIAMLEKLKGQIDTKVPELKKPWTEFGKEVSTIITNTAQSMAAALFDGDLSFGEKMKGMLKDIGEAVLSKFIQPAVSAIANFITGTLADLLSGKGLGGVLGHLKDIGGAIVDIFKGGSGVAGAAGQVAGAAGGIGSAAGGIAGAGGSAGSAAGQAAGTGLSATVGMVTGAISAVSGVIGNVQFMAMNKSLDLIEHEVRFSKIHLGYILEKLNDYLPKLEDIWKYLWQTQIQALNNFTAIMEDNLAFRLVEIRDGIQAIAMSPALAAGNGAPSIVIQNNTFSSRADIDYMMAEMAKRLRETGNTL